MEAIEKGRGGGRNKIGLPSTFLRVMIFQLFFYAVSVHSNNTAEVSRNDCPALGQQVSLPNLQQNRARE